MSKKILGFEIQELNLSSIFCEYQFDTLSYELYDITHKTLITKVNNFIRMYGHTIEIIAITSFICKNYIFTFLLIFFNILSKLIIIQLF